MAPLILKLVTIWRKKSHFHFWTALHTRKDLRLTVNRRREAQKMSGEGVGVGGGLEKRKRSSLGRKSNSGSPRP